MSFVFILLSQLRCDSHPKLDLGPSFILLLLGNLPSWARCQFDCGHGGHCGLWHPLTYLVLLHTCKWYDTVICPIEQSRTWVMSSCTNFCTYFSWLHPWLWHLHSTNFLIEANPRMTTFDFVERKPQVPWHRSAAQSSQSFWFVYLFDYVWSILLSISK